MLDGVSLGQLRTIIAAADEGSFTAAGRQLRRAQSVVSQTVGNLERRPGLKLLERRGRLPALTDQGRALLADVRAVALDVVLPDAALADVLIHVTGDPRSRSLLTRLPVVGRKPME